MLTLIPVLLGGALAAILSQAGTREPANAWVALGGAAGLPLLAFLLAWFAGSRGVRAYLAAEGEAASDRALRRHLRLQLLTWATLLSAFALVLEGGRLASFARSVAGPFDGEALLVPWVATSFALWAGSAAGERAASSGRSRGVRAVLGEKARRVLLPIAVGLALDLGGQLLGSVPAVRELLDLNPRARTLGLAALVLVTLALAPLVVRLLTPTGRLPGFPGVLPGDLAAATRNLSFRSWDLGSPVATACVAGILPFFRTVFLTDRLLVVLDPAETAAVLRHELGHAQLGHLSTLAIAAAGFVALLDDAAAGLPGLVPESGAIALSLGAIAVFALAFLFLSRRLEHDADLYAAQGGGSATPVVNALAKVTAVNGARPERGGFRHPSATRRIELLLRADADPALATRRLRRSRWLLRAILLAAGVALGWSGSRLAVDARRPLRERLVLAAGQRLAGPKPEREDQAIALAYLDRALAVGIDARALLLRARAWPPAERERARRDLDEAAALAPEGGDESRAIESARSEIFLPGGVEGSTAR
jgi:Zn-dependent protease with chaperone function